MKPITLSYRRLINLGNFENEAIELAFEIEPGDTPEDVLAAARGFVISHLPTLIAINVVALDAPPDDGAPPPNDPEWAALDRAEPPAWQPEQPHGVTPLDPAAPRRN